MTDEVDNTGRAVDTVGEPSRFLAAVNAAAADGSLRGLTLSKPASGAARTTVRPVMVGGRPRWQLEWRQGPQTHHENVPLADLLTRLGDWLPSRFAHAHAFTTAADWSLRFGKRGPKLNRSRPSRPDASPGDHDRDHDRGRDYLIPEGTPCPALEEAGVMGPGGVVPKSRRRKFRQINRFLELVDDVYPRLPTEGSLRVVDFGSGKSHLTFALHHLLAGVRGREVELLSVDRNAAVVDNARAAAARMGLRGVRHAAASIADVDIPQGTQLAVWLHACDTATDDAIAKSVAAGVDVILAVPCCQHELNAAIASDSLLFGHGLLRERAAAIATDALRAAALERLGYRTQVLEFIDLEHTAKNVLIRAVRRGEPVDTSETARRYAALKTQLGIDSWALERAVPSLASP